MIGQNFLQVFSQSKIFSDAFSASQFRPKNFFGAFGASNNSGSPEGGGSPPQPHPPTPPLSKPLPCPLPQAVGNLGNLGNLGFPSARKRGSKQLKAVQTWFKLIHEGELDAFRDLVRRNPTVLQDVDQTGASPLHLLLLHNTHESVELAKEILGERPELCTVTYQGGQYKGQVRAPPRPCPRRPCLSTWACPGMR